MSLDIETLVERLINIGLTPNLIIKVLGDEAKPVLEEKGFKEVKSFHTFATTLRSAIFKARRWFYATLKREGWEKEASVERWRGLVNKIIAEAERSGITKQPSKLTINYMIEEKIFKPVNAVIGIYSEKDRIIVRAEG